MKKLLCLCASLMLVAACSKKNDPIQNARVAAKDKDLQAKSFVACDNTPLKEFGSLLDKGIEVVKGKLDPNAADPNAAKAALTASHKTTYKFEGANVHRITETYGQANCKGDPNYTITEGGTFDLNHNPDAKSNDNGYPIDFKIDKLTVKINTDPGAANANNNELCGAKDWAKNKEKEVTTQTEKCIGGLKLPLDLAARYRVDGKNLQLAGAGWTSTTDKDRPKTLTGSPVYVAQ